MLISIIILVVVGLLAYWIITTFFPEPIRMVALVIVGILLLIGLLNITGILGSSASKLIG